MDNKLTQKELFKCNLCGFCCKLEVKLTKKDIEVIKKLNYKESYFIEKRQGENYLKKINGECIFLKSKNNKKKCTIYEYRPKICREFPFQRDENKIYYKCKQADNTFNEKVMLSLLKFGLEENKGKIKNKGN